MRIKRTRIYVLYAFIFSTALFSSMTSLGHSKGTYNKKNKKVRFHDEVTVKEFRSFDTPDSIRSNRSNQNQSSIDYRIPVVAAGLLIIIPTTIWLIKKYKRKGS